MKNKPKDESLELEVSFNELKTGILEHFSDLEDPRDSRNIKYRLSDIIFMTICAVISGANNLKEVVIFVHSKSDWFLSILNLPGRIPHYSVFWWTFVLIKPKALHDCFVNWVQALTRSKLGKHIAVDGKALRATRESGSFVHMVSAWASDLHLTLALKRVDAKSNEITAIPEVLEALDLEETTVTIDAMGCQKEVAKLIQKKGGDYILALKGNQGLMHDELCNFFDQAKAVGFEGVQHDKIEEESIGHGRVERRQVYVCSELDWLPQKGDWEGLRTIVLVVSERRVGDNFTREDRYYISSREANAEQIAEGIRSHWGIENSCHWVLDVAFQEDHLKGRSGHFAENMALMRRIALNLLKQDRTTKAGISAKRKKAGWDLNYLRSLLSVKSLV